MRHAREAGQTLPLVGLVLGVLLGFAGLAIDVGYLRYEQRLQQTAADSAALAGAYEKIIGGNVLAAARQDAAKNGFTHNGTDVIVDAVSPPSAGAYTSSSNAVEATVTTQQPTFFMRVLSYSTFQVQTRAVALESANANGCLYVLNSSANFNKGTVTAPNCGLVLNGGANFTGSTIDAGSITCATGTTCSNGTFTSATPAPALPVPDPCSQIPGCAYLKANSPPTTPCVAPANTTPGHISPGCYPNGWNFNRKSATLDPGLYVITGGTFDGHFSGTGTPSTLTGNGVTIYLTGSASLNFAGANLNLQAPTSGDYSSNYLQGEQKILFYQDPADNSGPNLQTAVCDVCTSTMSGVLYFPTQTVNLNKSTSNTSGSGYALMIFGGVNLNKSATTLLNGPAPNQSYILEPLLGE